MQCTVNVCSVFSPIPIRTVLFASTMLLFFILFQFQRFAYFTHFTLLPLSCGMKSCFAYFTILAVSSSAVTIIKPREKTSFLDRPFSDDNIWASRIGSVGEGGGTRMGLQLNLYQQRLCQHQCQCGPTGLYAGEMGV